MKGLTHNLLACLKCSSYPLKVQVDEGEVEQLEVEFDAAHILRVLPKLDWGGLLGLQADVKAYLPEDLIPLPAEQPVDLRTNEQLLRTIHFLVMELKVLNGALSCPAEGCTARFPIKDTIPNMVLNEI
eukprot:TRINITY_DN22607_c0_g1_i1.p2 TRINITY_DN22607_c0_g1~~TRINITY_DN22607_c0_g1_i1.p2  ORF type:complete len:128 (+),score=67.53 TRINITY_DN22607_c0_g1_i1:85-468(+)